MTRIGVGWGDVLRLADDDEDVLVVAVDGEVLAGVDGCVAVMKLDELAVPVEERGGVGVLEGCVGCGVWRGCWAAGGGAGLSLAGGGGASQMMMGVAGVGSEVG